MVAAETFRAMSSQLHWAGYTFAAVVIAFTILSVFAKRILTRVAAREPHPDAPGRLDGDGGAADA